MRVVSGGKRGAAYHDHRGPSAALGRYIRQHQNCAVRYRLPGALCTATTTARRDVSSGTGRPKAQLNGLCDWPCAIGCTSQQKRRSHLTPRSLGSRRPGSPKSRLRTAPPARCARIETGDEKARERDLPDLVDMLLATGLRVGEALAVTWDAVDISAGTVEVGDTVIRVKERGLMIKPARKTRAGFRTLLLPSWAVEMLRLRPPGRPDQTVFCSALGGLRDRDNALGDLRNALNAAGFEWVTSHTFRRTVTTLMDQSGLTARAAADQLGHSHPSLTQDVYYGRRIANTGAADVLEVFG
jgi:integrase